MIAQRIFNPARGALHSAVLLIGTLMLSGCLDLAAPSASAVPGHGKAPELAGIESWINSPPLSLAGLRGKVVLVEFWTHQCINCMRVLPHVTRWYDTYQDQGFVVIGVHTPESAEEEQTAGLKAAIERFNIKYPVAQDNGYATWKAYGNQFWPAYYLVDRHGMIVRTHVGEGDYAETEAAIRALLADDNPAPSGSFDQPTPELRSVAAD